MILRLKFPHVELDPVLIILAIGIILPWLQGIFKSIEFMGAKIELNEIIEATTKANQIENNTINEQIPISEKVNDVKPTFLSLIERDASLAIVGLRIEIEKRLKILAATYDIPLNANVSIIANQLRDKGLFNDNTLQGLMMLIKFGNQAAHGIEVDKGAIDEIFFKGREILKKLDLLHAMKFKASSHEDLKVADIILSFEGIEVIETSIDILGLAIHSDKVMLKLDDSIKTKTGEILIKLGALIAVEDLPKGKFTKYRISPFGNALYTYLINK